ncbi:ATP-binding protein [Bacillaceae bacterium IKA-2]|nr:ATP-binding protein [Bacillaceae bacterium IKA-2]
MSNLQFFNKITKCHVFLLIICLIGCSLFVIHNNNYFLEPIFSEWLLAILLAVAIFLLNIYRIVLPHQGNSLTMETAIYLSSLFVFGIEMALSVLFLGNFLFFVYSRNISWWKHLFNFSMFTITVCSAYYIFMLSGGLIGSITIATTFPYLLSIVTYFSINIVLVSLYFLLNDPSSNNSLFSVVKEVGQEAIGNYIIILALAFILAILLESSPIFGTIIFTFVMVLASLEFMKYFQLYEKVSTDKVSQEQILNSLPVGIITVRGKFSDFFLNSTAKSFLENAENKIKQMTNEVQNQNEYFWGILSSEKICHNLKVPYKKNDNTHLLLVSQSPLYDQHKNSIGRNFYFIDITDTEDLEKRMHQSEKLAVLGELAAGAAHEIRNPLAVIHGFLTLMKQSFTKQEQEKYYIPLLLNEIDRINSITEDMLMIAKPGSPQFKEVDVSDIFSEIPNLYKHSPTEEQLKFNINLDNTKLLLDEKQIKQVMYNLIRNSNEAMNGIGTMTIYSELDKDCYRLFIEDTGPGIPKDIQKAIFDPFLTTKETGTGLGLTIVQRIIENHKGSIQLFSSSDQGTTFVISLPLTIPIPK